MNPVAADRPSPATPVTKDLPSLASGLFIPVLPHLQSLVLNKWHVDETKLTECWQSPVTSDWPSRVIDACNWHGGVIE